MVDKLQWNERIRYERLKRGWSQEMMAAHLSVDTRTVRDWEAGRHAPNFASRQQLSSIYMLSIEELGLLIPKLIK
jgi:ribosome-binding protein aMBF1 (putative translation factor)